MKSYLNSSMLGALKCFAVAGHSLSFTKAAAAMSITQSAISQQIRNLEQRLGYRLFLRHARGLILTANGAALLESVGKAFAAIEETLARLDVADTPLRVSCVPSFAMHWLMPRLVEFQRQQPQISIRLEAAFQAMDVGIWLAARRLHRGKFIWPHHVEGTLSLSRVQLDALVLGLPWQMMGEAGIIRVL